MAHHEARKYRCKPTEPIEAVQWDGTANHPGVSYDPLWNEFLVTTADEVKMRLDPGDWIVTESSNPERHYPMSAEDFAALYEPIEEGLADGH